jgi:Flp pilus assembly pilin Flp
VLSTGAMRTFKAFLRDESGATAIEYGLIAAGISIGIIAGQRPWHKAQIDILVDFNSTEITTSVRGIANDPISGERREADVGADPSRTLIDAHNLLPAYAAGLPFPRCVEAGIRLQLGGQRRSRV